VKTAEKILSNCVLAFQVLIVWLILFEERIEVPAILQAFGRMHPLLLHFPIGLIFIAGLLLFSKKYFSSYSEEFQSLILCLTAFFISLTTLMGLFLSMEGGYDQGILSWHKWSAVVLSFTGWMLIVPFARNYLKPIVGAGMMLVIVAGHYGATLTHGDQYVTEPLATKTEPRALSDSSTFYAAAIEPILEAKCVGCHREGKSKGKLILTSDEGQAKGGKNGKLWVAGDAAHSLIVERIGLPLQAKEHMPPKDKAQLTDDEKNLIALWIDRGADKTVKLASLPHSDSLMLLSMSVRESYNLAPREQRKYDFKFASMDAIASLNLPNRSVIKLAAEEPALSVNFYLRDAYNRKLIEDLLVVKEQIVSINLSNMPVADRDLNALSEFSNLERLILNNTPVNGEFIRSLPGNDKLKIVSLSGSAIKAEHLQILAQHKGVKQVYFWNTGIGDEDVAALRKSNPSIMWYSGYRADRKELLRLTPPILKNESLIRSDEKIELKHNLPGVTVRYTLDGSDPDSLLAPVYDGPIEIHKYSVIKAKAYKEGWRSSESKEFIVFKEGLRPDEATLLTKSEQKYEGEGVETLINGLKGMPDFYKDPSWIGFRENAMDLRVVFKNKRRVRNITLSYARNVWAMCMPPASVEIWASQGDGQMKLLSRKVPLQPDTWVSNRTEGLSIDIPESDYTQVKIIARPLAKLPAFREEKKQKGWLMLDEVFFN
jgi:hypothetical protein